MFALHASTVLDSSTARPTAVCWNCQRTHHGELFCPACQAIQPFPEQADYFEVLGLPHTPVVDLALLQQHYYELHRQLHPDLFQSGPPQARQTSLRNTAAVNQAFRTLRDPEDRGLYWLTLKGESIGQNNNRIPPELTSLVFETQEKLEEMRDGKQNREELTEVHQSLESQRQALNRKLEENFEAWDKGSASQAQLLSELKAHLSKLAYLGRLIRDVDKALEH